MIGKTCGKIKVIEFSHIDIDGHAWWEGLCDCGSGRKIYRGKSLRNGNTQSCGCVQKERARSQGYKNKRNEFNKLLEDTNLSHYYMGLIFADGSFSNNCDSTTQFSIGVSLLDKDYFVEFSKFLNCNFHISPKNNKIVIACRDKRNIPKIMEKFDLKFNKTYMAGNFNKIKFSDNDKFFSFLIGFIDGDGHINNQHRSRCQQMTMKLYKAWYQFLIDLNKYLQNTTEIFNSRVTIEEKHDLCCLFLNHEVISFLKEKAVELKLPYFKRKWDKVDLKYKKYQSRKEQQEKDNLFVLNLLKENKSPKEIMEPGKFKKTKFYYIIRRLKTFNKSI